jgi:hypothetical protein
MIRIINVIDSKLAYINQIKERRLFVMVSMKETAFFKSNLRLPLKFQLA